MTRFRENGLKRGFPKPITAILSKCQEKSRGWVAHVVKIRQLANVGKVYKKANCDCLENYNTKLLSRYLPSEITLHLTFNVRPLLGYEKAT